MVHGSQFVAGGGREEMKPDQPRTTDPEPPTIELGRIVNRHGVRGEVRVRPHNRDTSAFKVLREVELRYPDGHDAVRTIEGARRHRSFVLLRFAGVDSASDAETLVGCTVHARRADLPDPEPGSWYAADLIGCAVRTDGGLALGHVVEVMNAGSADVLVVRENDREHLIPLIADVIDSVEPAERRIVVRPIPGLLDGT